MSEVLSSNCSNPATLLIMQIPSTLSSPARLITIPVSHYCEKTRWALTRAKMTFVEEAHMPPFHRFATRKISKRSPTNSLPETEQNLSLINRFVAQQVGGQSVPVLITETEVFRSSREILDYVNTRSPDELKIYPLDPKQRQQVDELVELFDSVLAPAVRLWAYSYLIDYPDLIQSLWCQGVPQYQSWLFPLMYPWMRTNVVQLYGLGDAAAIAAYASIAEIFAQVGNSLTDGRLYLVGDRFSAADLAFATLAAAVVLPSGYGIKLPDLAQLPTPMAERIQQLQATIAGKFVWRLYQEYSG